MLRYGFSERMNETNGRGRHLQTQWKLASISIHTGGSKETRYNRKKKKYLN